MSFHIEDISQGVRDGQSTEELDLKKYVSGILSSRDYTGNHKDYEKLVWKQVSDYYANLLSEFAILYNDRIEEQTKLLYDVDEIKDEIIGEIIPICFYGPT